VSKGEQLASILYTMSPVEATTWSANWAWALPLIVLTVIIHVCGLATIKVRGGHERRRSNGHPSARSGSGYVGCSVSAFGCAAG
jgi:hypothetical protein